jgi:hypothetical protein
MSNIHKVNNNIYITNSEEIKEGDWCIDEKENVVKADKNFIFNCSHEFDEFWRKIILTTDQDLIADGVQSIDDTFLEWFVKNQTCEKVEIGEGTRYEDEWIDNEDGGEIYQHQYCCYKIIIPQEEPTMITDWLDKHGDPEIYKKVEKQLELEDAAERFYREYPTNPLDKPEWHYNRDVDCFKKRKAFINGAKYMAEKMYSEEQLFKILLDFVEFPHDHNEGRGSIINRFLMELKNKKYKI